MKELKKMAMKNFLLPLACALIFGSAQSALADSFLVLHETPLRQSPSDKGKVLDKAAPGWLLHGEAAQGDSGAGWCSLHELQRKAEDGFIYTHLAYPKAQGSVFIKASEVMQVPEQGEVVNPAEDRYTPSCDVEGIVFRSKDGKPLAFGKNWIQKARDFQFAGLFAGREIPGLLGSAPCTFHFEKAVRDKGNAWQYHVEAAASGLSSSEKLSGTLTLKKAALISGKYGTPCIEETNTQTASSLTEVHQGFAGAELVLQSSDARLSGILISYFYLRFNPKKMAFDKDALLNDIPNQTKNPQYRNLQFAGTYEKGDQKLPCLFGMGRLPCAAQ